MDARFSLALVPLVLSSVALLALLASGPGTRSGVWGFRTGLMVMRVAAYTGGGACIMAAVALALATRQRARREMAVSAAAIVLGLVVHQPVLLMQRAAHAHPMIHDISTDTVDPPAFVKILPLRSAPDLNPAVYAGPELARQQKEGYPDLAPHHSRLPPKDTFARALEVAKRQGWEMVDADAPSGRLEATDTTAFFGFKDDVVIRVRPEGAGSVLDVRSVSRVGRSDLGKNAERIRSFLAALDAGSAPAP